MNIPLVDITINQYSSKVLKKVQKLITSGDFILGKQVEEFEKNFAKYIGSKYCIGVSSGADALLLSLRALDIGEGDEVIIPAMTFMATASAVIHSRATPVLVDITPDLPLIDLSQIEKKINKKTKAIIPVHLHGYPCDMDALKRIAKKHNLFIIEDACQSHGSLYKGHRTGNSGVAAAFSFYPSKNLGAFGDAGAVTTSNKVVAEKILILRNQGSNEKYFHEVIGYNARLDTLQSIILNVKLNNLDKENALRRKHASLYRKLLADLPIGLPKDYKDLQSNYHVFAIRVQNRDELLKYLKNKGIQASIHYPLPLHLQPALSYLNCKNGDYPNAEKFAKETLSLPMYSGLTKVQIGYICDQIKRFYKF